MKKILKMLVVLLAAVFGVLQLFRPSFTNPPIVPGQPIEDSGTVPADVQMLLSRSCSDCHSNKTLYPWYARISPVSWWLADHIEKGRSELNFSEWNSYSARKKDRKLEEICDMVRSGAMPLPSYLWMHRSADLSPDQREVICGWVGQEREKLSEE